MISDALLKVEELIVRTPGLLARLSDPPIPNYEIAKAQKIAFDYFEAEEESDGQPPRPFFVLREAEVSYSILNSDDLQGYVAIEVCYTEAATSPNDHKASKLYFLNFVSAMLESIATRQGQSIDDQPGEAYVSIHGMRVIQQAGRSAKSLRDKDRENSDYWMIRWVMMVGEPGAV